MKRKANIPIFIADRGCRGRCVFCNQKKISGETRDITPQDAAASINDYLKSCSVSPRDIEIAFFGGSFSGLDPVLQEEFLSVAHGFVKDKRAGGIRLSTRPDLIDETVLRRFKRYGVTAVELGAQSMDDRVLDLSGRGHTADDTIAASGLIKSAGFELGLQMMVGLPGDDEASTMMTARKISKLSPDTVRIYPTLVIKQTPLYELYLSGEYVPLSLDEAVLRCAEIVQLFKRVGINILRLGLMDAQGLREGDVVAGPYHPSFGELVYSKIFLSEIEQRLKVVDCAGRAIKILCAACDISKIRGNKNKNINHLKKSLGLARIEVAVGDAAAPDGFDILFY